VTVHRGRPLWERLKAEVARLFAEHKGKRGSPMITADLRDLGWRVSKNTVAAVMAEMGLAARPKKRRKGTTRPGKGRWRAPDLVKRDFPAAGINQKWYGDGTDIDTDEGKLYLDSVLDVGSRRVLGFALGEHHDADLAYGALAMAVAVRGGQVPGVIFHTDQGSEYTAGLFRAPASGFRFPSRWAGPGRRWITPSSNRGTRPWNSSCGASSTSRPGRSPGPGSRPGSRTTTTTAGTRRWAGYPRWITSGRWRERTPRDRGPAAARPRTRRRRLRRRSPSP
jgi:Integrase core domain/HTH-like domain